jgi:hypothetical protein
MAFATVRQRRPRAFTSSAQEVARSVAGLRACRAPGPDAGIDRGKGQGLALLLEYLTLKAEWPSAQREIAMPVV